MDLTTQQSAQKAIDYTDTLIQRYGPRLAGTDRCLQAAQHLHHDLQSICGRARLEYFQTHPGVFNGFFLLEPLFHFLFTIAALLGWVRLAAPGYLLTIVYGFLQFGYYKEYFKHLFPQRTCANVTAHLEPQQDVRQQIIISGHHDSAHEMRMLRRHQKLYALKVIIPDMMLVASSLAAWIWLGVEFFTGHAPAFAFSLQVLWWISIPVVGSKMWMIGKNGTPGAGDNLIASAMLVELADHFAAQSGRNKLAHTRLIFASFDAEEAGLRGARAYAQQHAQELTALPTWMINIDSIYELNELKFLTTDLNDTIPLDLPLATHCLNTAEKSGYRAHLEPMKFGGGSTDAAELAKIGVRCTTILAMSTQLIRDGLVYHTMQDLPEAIEPQAVKACLDVIMRVVEEMDQACVSG